MSEAKTPDWYRGGLDRLWRPYTQMKTANPPLAAEMTRGTRIVLADGRELVDGIAMGVAQQASAQSGLILKVMGFVFDLLIAGLAQNAERGRSSGPGTGINDLGSNSVMRAGT